MPTLKRTRLNVLPFHRGIPVCNQSIYQTPVYTSHSVFRRADRFTGKWEKKEREFCPLRPSVSIALPYKLYK